MSAQVYADGELIYDPNLEGYELFGLVATPSVKAAGTAELKVPLGHPYYSYFIEYRTIMTIYRSGKLIFRGRVLLPSVDFDRTKTITCEGERCFLRDAVIEPYLYQADPAVIFSDLIARYNDQVDENKRFTVGEITVQDPNGYIRLECESAESVYDVVEKLVDRVGGYIIFSTNSDGSRAINWYAALSGENTQIIDFGENLLDLTVASVNPNFATIIWPYGAKDETTGKRVTIEAVNDGKRTVENPEAIARYGRIAVPVYWDDVTLAENLKRKAIQYREENSQIYTAFEVKAVDLAQYGVDIETLHVGAMTRIRSEAHELNALYPVYERSYDLMDGTNDTIHLGWETSTLTKSDVAGDKASYAQLQRTEQSIKTDYQISLTDAVARLKK